MEAGRRGGPEKGGRAGKVDVMMHSISAALLVALAALVEAAPTDSTAVLRFGTVEIDPGQEARLPLYVRSPAAVHGLSLSFFYDARQLELSGFRVNPEVLSPQSVKYAAVWDHPEENYAVLGVLFIWDKPCADCGLPPTPDGQEVLAGYLVFKSTLATQPAVYEIQPQNDLGNPPVANTFSVEGGRSILPSLESGSVVVRNHNVLRLGSTTVEPGQSAELVLQVDHLQPLGGLQISLRYDTSLVHLRADSPESDDICARSITPCGAAAMAPYLSGGIEKFILNVNESLPDDTGWAVAGLVFDYLPPFEDQLLPPGEGQEVLICRFEVRSDVPPGTDVPVTFTNELGDPPVGNKVLLPLRGNDGRVTELVSIVPILQDGVIRVRYEPRKFRRGFVNADGRVNIGDVLAVLGFLFVHEEEPACLKAADINDDGRVNVGDAIYLLGYLFTPGFDQPPPPFFDCGLDPTPDGLSCRDWTPGCP